VAYIVHNNKQIYKQTDKQPTIQFSSARWLIKLLQMCVKYTNLCIVHLPLSDNNYSLFHLTYKALIKGATFATNYTNNKHNY